MDLRAGSSLPAMIELAATKDVDPICPHCDHPLTKVLFRELSGILGRRYVYFCSACRKVLGISHRKGFLMG